MQPTDPAELTDATLADDESDTLTALDALRIDGVPANTPAMFKNVLAPHAVSGAAAGVRGRVAIVTLWRYPFGGGEASMYHTMRWNAALGYETYWLSFGGAGETKGPSVQGASFAGAPQTPANGLGLRETPHGVLVDVPGGFSVGVLRAWLRWLMPDVVHHQGHRRREVMEAARALGIPMLTGFNFWDGAVHLGAAFGNTDVLQHLAEHAPDPDFAPVMDYCETYAASEFVQDVLESVTGHRVPHVVYSVPDAAECRVPALEPTRSPYVAMVNVHAHKGGRLLLALLRACPDIPFLCVQTEPGSEALDAEIRAEVQKRNAAGAPDSASPSLYLGFQSDMKSVYAKTRVLLVPSEVDETFGRVALEGLINGIAVMTSGRGHLGALVGDAAEVLPPGTSADAWASRLTALYADAARLQDLRDRGRARAERFSADIARAQYAAALAAALARGGARHVMLLTPWCDQGLGIQSRVYDRILAEAGWKSHVFAMKSYFWTPSNPRHQQAPAEWAHERVYYSEHVREAITDDELLQFVDKYRIRVAVVPETCFDRIFDIAALLRRRNVRTVAIPNVEILRRTELFRHAHFDLLLANNRLCERVLKTHGFPQARYVGFALPPVVTEIRPKARKALRFLCLGGMNAFSRKQVVPVLEAFVQALNAAPDMRITVTLQGQADDPEYRRLAAFAERDEVRVHHAHMTSAEVAKLYAAHDCVIQMSHQEGLGLNFFEALAHALPVITMQTPPHNEVISHPALGWTVPCGYVPMKHNDDAFFGSAVFDPDDLAAQIAAVAALRGDWDDVRRRLVTCRDELLSWPAFCARFTDALAGVLGAQTYDRPPEDVLC